MAEIQTGRDYKLKRPTFLHNGVFVLQNTPIQMMEITNKPDKVIVQFLDREGFPHTLKGIGTEELE